MCIFLFALCICSKFYVLWNMYFLCELACTFNCVPWKMYFYAHCKCQYTSTSTSANTSTTTSANASMLLTSMHTCIGHPTCSPLYLPSKYIAMRSFWHLPHLHFVQNVMCTAHYAGQCASKWWSPTCALYQPVIWAIWYCEVHMNIKTEFSFYAS